MTRINPYQNSCRLELEIPWELAQALLPLAQELVTVLAKAVAERGEVQSHAENRKADTDRTAEDNRAAWRALAEECEAEAKRRANGPGSRRSILRQLAAERNLSPIFLERIVRVYRREARKEQFAARVAEIEARRAQGQSTGFIAGELGISARMVRKYLEETTARAPKAAQEPTR